MDMFIGAAVAPPASTGDSTLGMLSHGEAVTGATTAAWIPSIGGTASGVAPVPTPTPRVEDEKASTVLCNLAGCPELVLLLSWSKGERVWGGALGWICCMGSPNSCLTRSARARFMILMNSVKKIFEGSANEETRGFQWLSREMKRQEEAFRLL